jgi:hypothetical protein
MESTSERSAFAWQPLTPRGVAAFAGASLGRLLVVQFCFGLLAAATVMWLLHGAWFPRIGEAISRLPAAGEIRAGKLEWQGDSPAQLSDGRFLAVAVDLDHEGKARSPAHVLVEFGRSDVRIYSLFGFAGWSYPKAGAMPFNREELEPRWGAWAPALLAVTGGLVVAALMLTWAALATAYFFPAWLVGFYADRELSVRGSWRLAGAALMPGAIFLTVAIFFYGLAVLDVVHLMVAGALHLVLSWIYVVVSPLYLARQGTATGKENPFATAGETAVRNKEGTKTQ